MQMETGASAVAGSGMLIRSEFQFGGYMSLYRACMWGGVYSPVSVVLSRELNGVCRERKREAGTEHKEAQILGVRLVVRSTTSYLLMILSFSLSASC